MTLRIGLKVLDGSGNLILHLVVGVWDRPVNRRLFLSRNLWLLGRAVGSRRQHDFRVRI